MSAPKRTKERGGRTGRHQSLWSDDELGFLQDHWNWPSADVAEALGRTRRQVNYQRSRITRGVASIVPQRWTADDLSFLRDNPHLTSRQAAAALGRTYESVRAQRAIMSRHEGIRFGSTNKSPYRPGRRTIVAMTCRGCGLILDGSWFQRSAQGVTTRTRCIRCYPRTPISPEGAARRAESKRGGTSEWVKRLQVISAERAERAGQEYTSDDLRVLSDPDITVIEKALRLGRTYHAVVSACHQRGYTSKKGRGDPTNWQWSIYAPMAKELLEALQ